MATPPKALPQGWYDIDNSSHYWYPQSIRGLAWVSSGVRESEERLPRAKQPVSAEAARLQRLGYKLTAPRQTIMRALQEAGRYCTASQLYAQLPDAGIGLASVYRTLDLLATAGLAVRRAEPGGEASFLYCSPEHHHHVICVQCGKVSEIGAAFCPDTALVRAVEAATDFQIMQHTLDFQGLCPACRQVGAAGAAG